MLAVVASCVSFTAYGQNRADDSGVASFSILGSLLAPGPVAAPAAAPVAASAVAPVYAPAATPPMNPVVGPVGTSAVGTAPSGLSAETPWFQRFLLPVPEATGSVDDWIACSRPGLMANVDYLNWSAPVGLGFRLLRERSRPDCGARGNSVARFRPGQRYSRRARLSLRQRMERGVDVHLLPRRERGDGDQPRGRSRTCSPPRAF